MRTPEHYPDAVTLHASVDADGLLARVDATSGCSIKDSFADLDLTPRGFDPLFDATWIRRRAIQRSEEHTSELQSRRDLVCRLLLEKKKKRNIDSDVGEMDRLVRMWSGD